MNLLLAEDDEIFSFVMSRALAKHGYQVHIAHNRNEALLIIETIPLQFAILDLRLGNGSGMDLIEPLRHKHKGINIQILTGYGSIATAVEAIKKGANDYLIKPVDIHILLDSLAGKKNNYSNSQDSSPASLKRLEWEHIQQVLKSCDWNITKAAHELGMHRRTLQRKLNKRPVRY